ncbi:MAG: DNA-binding protein WhiA [Clostridia bacterium]|nr:DNA-binding protein WhiA [Candidatus Pelethousia sp.]NCB30505.1 DNA-binding protein WhiA [Clostridia bacterium]
MSFASETKVELVKLRLKTEGEKRALLCALTYSAGSITLGRGTLGVQYTTENIAVGELVARLAVDLYGVEAGMRLSESSRLRARCAVVRLAGPGCRALLLDAGCLGEEEETLTLGHIPEALVGRDEDRRCYLRGAFLGAGSINDPSKGYHLEIVCRHERFAQELCALLAAYDLPARWSARKSAFVAYLKEGEMVSDFLTLIGAMNSTLAFEEARVMRQVSGSVNRIRNFEDANMNKAAAAAAVQLVDIEYIGSARGLDTLPEKLREAAELRLNNPEATLSELSELAEVSKSGLNHRFAKLSQWAQELREQGAGRIKTEE